MEGIWGRPAANVWGIAGVSGARHGRPDPGGIAWYTRPVRTTRDSVRESCYCNHFNNRRDDGTYAVAATFERWLGEIDTTDDTAHDISHCRVWMTAQKSLTGGRACYDPDRMLFHADIVSLPKTILVAASHPSWQRVKREILHRDFPDFPRAMNAVAQHAIEAHSFSAGSRRRVWEAKIVQDADRLRPLGDWSGACCRLFRERWACRF